VPGSDLLRPTAAVLGGSLAALAATLALRVVVARTFAPADLGLLLAAIALVSWAGGVASLGLNPAVARHAAEGRAAGDDRRARLLAGSGLRTASASGALAAVLVGGGAWLLAGRLPAIGWLELVPPLALVGLALAVGMTVVGASRAFGDVIARAVIRDAGGGVLRLLAVGGATLAGGSLFALAVAYTAATLAAETAALAWGAARGWFDLRLPGAPETSRPRELAPYAWLELLNQTSLWADLVLLGALAAPAEVGLFAVARALARALQTVQYAVAHAYLPALASAWRAGGVESLAAIYVRARQLTFALLWPGVALCLAVPGSVLGLLFGSDYEPAANALRLLAVGLGVDAMAGARELPLQALGAARSAARCGSAAVLIGLFAMLLLAPTAGAFGAAIAVTVMTVVRAALTTGALRRRAGITVAGHDLTAPVVGTLAVTALAALGAVLLRVPPLVAAVLVGAAASAGSVVLLFGVRRDPAAQTGAGSER
jgi:O-antigen/teichoic acid export membrane protein